MTIRNLIGAAVLTSLLLALLRFAPLAIQLMRAQPEAVRGQNTAAVSVTPPRNPTSAPPLRVLFVGNSHTFVNDMPSLILQLAAAARERRGLEASMIVEGGATLEDHLAQGKVRDRLAGERWDYVVLQDQQQRPAFTFNPKQIESQFFAPARTLDVLIRAASAKTILYMTAARRDGDPDNVPHDSYEAMQQRTTDSYTRLARELGAVVAPVGVAWRWAHRERPDLPLWNEDGYHPSLHGSYLTACVFYTILYAHSALDNAFTAGLPAADAQLLQKAADVSRFM